MTVDVPDPRAQVHGVPTTGPVAAFFARVGAEPWPVGRPLRDLFRTEALALRSAAEADAALGILISTVREKLIAADGRKLVPAVLDVLTRYYWTRHPSLWLGKGLKLASAALWGASGTRTDLDLVADCFGELALFERITTARVAFDLATTGLWVASAEGVTSTGEVQHALKDIANAFELRGGARRLMHGLWRAQEDARWFLGVNEVLSGAEPALVPALEGTFLTEVPASARGFWEGLACLAAIAAAVDRAAPADHCGVVTFDLAAIGGVLPTPAAALRHVERFVWTPLDAATTDPDALDTLLLRRPLVPLAPGDTRVATTFPIVFDAANWFLDASAFAFPGFEWSRLPQQYAQQHVEARFEESVREAFCELGFIVGSVDKKGTWRPLGPNQEPRRLVHAAGALCPGEIDVLAIQPDAGVGFVLECKVLRGTGSPTGIKNTFQRLALEDVSDFHSKLLAKCEWVGGVDNPVIRLGQLLFPLIVVDQPTIGQTYSGLVEDLGGVLARAQGYARP